MSTPLIALAAILAFFAVVLIPFMFIKGGQPQANDQQHSHSVQGKKAHKKKKRR